MKVTKQEMKALEQLESALGWHGRKPKLTSENFHERLETARTSAGLGLLICSSGQAASIRQALRALKASEKAVRS